jgi:hypothetical protein
MLNPSTADAAIDDPTIRRCIGFAKREGCGGLVVVNWFAWRATDPKELYKTTAPIGPENRWHIKQAAELCRGPLIAAWGANHLVKPLLMEIPELTGGRQLMCLGKTKDGAPRHPLYLPTDAPLVPYGEFIS